MKTRETDRLFIFFVIWAIIMLLLFATTQCNGQNIDIRLLRTINTPHELKMDGFMRGISNSTFMIVIGTPVAMSTFGVIDCDHKMLVNTLLLIASTAVNLGTTDIIKHQVNRMRPFDRYSDILDKSRMNPVFYDPSFPSGHTSSAFNMATFLSLAYPKWYVIAPAALWATSVAYSRMYLGVHYPSDVLAGAVLGAGTAYLTYYLNKHYSICRKFKPVKPLGWMN